MGDGAINLYGDGDQKVKAAVSLHSTANLRSKMPSKAGQRSPGKSDVSRGTISQQSLMKPIDIAPTPVQQIQPSMMINTLSSKTYNYINGADMIRSKQYLQNKISQDTRNSKLLIKGQKPK